MSSVTCTSCGSVNAEGAHFCGSCGAALSAPAPAATPSGWDLAAAGMTSPPPLPPTGPGSAFTKADRAGWWARLGGSILDGLILGVIAILVFGIAFSITAAAHTDDPTWSFTGDSNELGYGASVALGLTVIGFVLLTVLWEILWIGSKGMGKPGQRAAGFRVTDKHGARVTYGRATGRSFAKLIYSIPNIGWIPTIVSAFTIGISDDRQGLHDMMAGTMCTRTDALTARGIGPKGPGDGLTPTPPPAPTMHSPTYQAAPIAPPAMQPPVTPPAPPAPPASGHNPGDSGAMPPGHQGPFM